MSNIDSMDLCDLEAAVNREVMLQPDTGYDYCSTEDESFIPVVDKIVKHWGASYRMTWSEKVGYRVFLAKTVDGGDIEVWSTDHELPVALSRSALKLVRELNVR